MRGGGGARSCSSRPEPCFCVETPSAGCGRQPVRAWLGEVSGRGGGIPQDRGWARAAVTPVVPHTLRGEVRLALEDLGTGGGKKYREGKGVRAGVCYGAEPGFLGR